MNSRTRKTRITACGIGSLFMVMSGASGCRSPGSRQTETPLAQPAAGAVQPVPAQQQELQRGWVTWNQIELVSGDVLMCVVLSPNLAIQTDYGRVLLPRDRGFKVRLQEGAKNRVAEYSGPTVKQGAESNANLVRGTLFPDRIRVRLITGQELELMSDQIKSLSSDKGYQDNPPEWQWTAR